MADGKGLEAFRRDFRRIVAQRGWTGWTGWTGEGSKAGEAWRTKVIYQTNMTTSYAAGRYQQLTDPEFLRVRPYWRYAHSDGVLHPRPLHQQWGAMRLTLPAEHEFWKTHFPPNGWGCQCRVVPVAAPEGEDASEPPEGWAARDAKTGAPVGIDRGFDYAPGANRDTSLRELVAEKLIKYPPAITKALTRDLNRYLSAEYPPAQFAEAVLADRQLTHDQWLGFPDNYERIQQDTGLDVKGYIGILPAQTPRHVMNSHQYDGKGQRPATPEDYNSVWTVLAEADDIRAGSNDGHNHLDTIVAVKTMGGEKWRAVYEIRPGRKTRLLALVSLTIKTAPGR